MLIKSRSAKGFTNSRFLHSHGRSSGYKSSNSTKSGCSRWKQDLLVIGRIVEGGGGRKRSAGKRRKNSAKLSQITVKRVDQFGRREIVPRRVWRFIFRSWHLTRTHPPFVFRGFATIFYRDCLILLFATRPTIIFLGSFFSVHSPFPLFRSIFLSKDF